MKLNRALASIAITPGGSLLSNLDERRCGFLVSVFITWQHDQRQAILGGSMYVRGVASIHKQTDVV
jgi:hypothetical protein